MPELPDIAVYLGSLERRILGALRWKATCSSVCGAPVQRIVYAENGTNYCARCQTGGKIFADRALSRLFKKSLGRAPIICRAAPINLSGGNIG